jgi:hypothetical protein
MHSFPTTIWSESHGLVSQQAAKRPPMRIPAKQLAGAAPLGTA